MSCPFAVCTRGLGFTSGMSLRDHIVQARHLTMCLTLAMIPLLHFYVPPLFILGFTLFWVDMLLGGWQRVEWRRGWPLLFPLAFWLFSLIGVSWCTDIAEGMLQIKLRALFAVGPFMVIGLKPRRSWGTSIMVGTFALIVAVIIGGILNCIENGRFFIYSDLEEGMTIPWMLKNNYFAYDTQGASLRLLGKRLFNYPNAIAFHVIMTISILVHRMLLSWRRLSMWRRWGGIALQGFLLFFLLLTNTRAALLGFMVGAGYVMFELVFVRRWLNRWAKLGIVVVGIGMIVGFFSLSRFNVTTVNYWSNSTLKDHIESNPRFHAWTTLWRDRSAYLPWGTGTGGSRQLLQSYYENDEVLNYDQMSKVHNHYLEALVEWGYVGLLFVCCMMFWPLLWWRDFTLWHRFLWIAFWVLHIFESIVQDSRYVPFLTLYYLMWSLWYVHRGAKTGEMSLTDI